MQSRSVSRAGFGILASIIFIAAGLALVPTAHAQEIEWIRQFGSSSIDNARGISVDASGIYVAGLTSGTLPGQTSAGSTDAFVRKYDLDGNEVWTRQFGTPSGDNARGISVDASGIYVAGGTDGTLPGQTSAGSTDAFVVKLKLSILTPAEAIQEIIADVVALNLKQGISNSLDSKLDAAAQALDDLNQNNDVAAINALQALINSVEAQRGVRIADADADAIIAAVQAIIARLGG